MILLSSLTGSFQANPHPCVQLNQFPSAYAHRFRHMIKQHQENISPKCVIAMCIFPLQCILAEFNCVAPCPAQTHQDIHTLAAILLSLGLPSIQKKVFDKSFAQKRMGGSICSLVNNSWIFSFCSSANLWLFGDFSPPI